VTGKLYGVGVGPGDPELITLKAQRVIGSCDVVAYPGARHGSSIARRIAAPHLRDGQIELELRYPVTGVDVDRGYEALLAQFYDDCAAQLALHLDAGRDVAVLCEGDPFLYGSFMYLHERLAGRYRTEVIPGVCSFSAAAAATGTPLVRRDEALTILPGTLSADELAQRLRRSDAAVVLKLGRTFAKVRQAHERAGTMARSIYVERASHPNERIAPLAEVDGQVPYMSLVLTPGPARPAPATAAAAGNGARAPARGRAGRLAVVGLGPGGAMWLTPEAAAELDCAEELVGYESYLRRVAARPGQRRHASANRVESERARLALRLAAGGARVAVVSSGDPGVFAMAACVLEELDAHHGRYDELEVVVTPGVSAMQAVAARVGAPLGHDFCALSLSDNLKPWALIEQRLRAAAAADLVLALYNPASRSRRGQLVRALEVLAEQRAPRTPVVVARAVGSDDEQVSVVTLDQVPVETVDMRTLLIVGSSTTRTVKRPDGTTLVYTPRRHPGGGGGS
jgi:precorrin-2 C20-methyltransferase/precorrin-3B C17-methyltransferase